MDSIALQETAQQLVAKGKGILASDERSDSINKKLKEMGIDQTAEMRRQYREIFIGTDDLNEYITGMILSSETVQQKDSKGEPFPDVLASKDVLPGVKTDAGTDPLPFHASETLTTGLDGLRDALEVYKELGAKFTKWRATIAISETTPTLSAITANSLVLALSAIYTQEAGLVPILEPEVLINGNHSLEKSRDTLIWVLTDLFDALEFFDVPLDQMILKTSMALPGDKSGEKATPEQVAEATLRALTLCVPKETAGIVFLSGGQGPEEATANLNAVAQRQSKLPWPVTFSFLRAIEGPALEVWQGKEENVPLAREAFIKRLRLNKKALAGEYTSEMERK